MGECHCAIDMNAIDSPSPAWQTDVEKTAGASPDSQEAQFTKDYSRRAHWIRAALLGANEGVVSVSSIMMGIEAVESSNTTLVEAGFVALVAGTCKVAICELVSMYTLRDVEKSQRKRELGITLKDVLLGRNERLPNPVQAGILAGLSFVIGGTPPLVVSAFMESAKVRVPVMIAVASTTLVLLGLIGGILGRSPILRSCLRVLVGGSMVMAITFVTVKSVSTVEKQLS